MTVTVLCVIGEWEVCKSTPQTGCKIFLRRHNNTWEFLTKEGAIVAGDYRGDPYYPTQEEAEESAKRYYGGGDWARVVSAQEKLRSLGVN